MTTKYLKAAASYNVRIANEPRKQFYVYVYSMGGIPFYVGVGEGQRYLHHLAKSHSVLLQRKLAKLKRDRVRFTIKIVFHTNIRDRANVKETELIDKHGRLKDGGTLYNLTIGGDGGDTISGKSRYYNPRTGEQTVFTDGTQPKNWVKGVPAESTVKGYRNYYDPKTNERTRLPAGERPPRGWVAGNPLLGNTGPRGKVIIHNPTTQVNKWVYPTDPVPDGWLRGRLPDTTTGGRVAYHDPATGAKKYLQPGERPPRGWKLGLKPTTGNPVKVGKLRFDSVQAAMNHFNTSRYLLCKRSDFKQL